MYSINFSNDIINFQLLRKRAHNLRWAEVADGIIPLTAADPDFPCAAPIVEAIKKFAAESYFSYGPSEGLPEFKEAVSSFMYLRRNVMMPASNILPVDSAAFGIHLICKSFLCSGDEAIIFDPVDFLFRFSIEQAGAVAVPFATPQSDIPIDFTPLESLISSRTKMICLCNPLNPTGKVFSPSELKQLADIALRHKLIILSDEIWSDIIFSGQDYTSIASHGNEIRENTIIVTGFSKSYGLAGLRIGAVMTANNEWYKKILSNSLFNSTINGVNLISQIAATSALNECSAWLADFVLHLESMRDFFVEGLNRLPGIKCKAPQGCYVAFANIKETGMSSEQIQAWLLDQAKVSVVPGLKKWFGEGAEGYIRFSFATSKEVLSEALFRMEKAFKII